MAAIDPFSGNIYQTFNDKGGIGYIDVYRYNAGNHDAVLTSRTEISTLGSATSIALSADYRTMYYGDNTTYLHARLAQDLTPKWSIDLGYAPRGCAIVNPNGYIVPNGARDDPAYVIRVIQDRETYAEVVFETQDYAPLCSASAGDDNRFVVVARHIASGDVRLVVFGPDGIVSETSWGADQPNELQSTAIGADGSVFVIGRGGTALKKFVANQSGSLDAADGEPFTRDLHLTAASFSPEAPGCGVPLESDNACAERSTDAAVTWDPEFTGSLHLGRAVSNPGRPFIEITYGIAPSVIDAGPVEFGVYCATGRLVRTFSDATRAPLSHTVTWDGNDDRGCPVPSGVYFFRLAGNGEVETRRVVLVR